MNTEIHNRASVFALSIQNEEWRGEAFLRFIELAEEHAEAIELDRENLDHIEAKILFALRLSAKVARRQGIRRQEQLSRENANWLARSMRAAERIEQEEQKQTDLDYICRSLRRFAEVNPETARHVANWANRRPETRTHERKTRLKAIQRFRAFCLEE